jgi:polysaccharide export outer membrane protein
MVAALAGCNAMGNHAEKRIPQYGVVDLEQPRELNMVSQPPYVVEPPDELEITARPAALELLQTTVTVQIDGNIDLGFYGDVYVAGLTLEQIEDKIAQQVAAIAAKRQLPVKEAVQVSVRLVNGTQSKRFYVLGTITNQASFPITGNETVLDGILQAGLRSNSLPEKAYLVRPHPSGGPDQILKIDWFGIKVRGDTTTNYQLFPGDRIVVPGGKAPGLLSTLLGGG